LDPDSVVEAIEAGDSEERVKALLVDLLEGEDLALETSGFDLEETVKAVLDDNPGAVADYRDGEENAMNFLVGQVMQRSKGQADPGEARDALRDRLE
ncbi:MAG: Asp-tRNA(Asn)/Glu-tRNA(Gln) amidotransferase GatCAB subunit B, partial [Candidatus Nanohaloarchaea archaeon]|nr:Asp-tRNA(Asn)/Glu-tRNA(Gln) amidotransferase GatCAB subunit B [Candidatus Nanohaloarchaea archaeon]